WLEGKTSQPVDLSDNPAMQLLADTIGAVALERLQELPACTDRPDEAEINALSTDCLPSNTSPQQLADELHMQIRTGASSASQDGGNEAFRDGYRWSGHATPVFAAILTLAATGIMLLSSSRRRGARIICGALIASGLLLAISFWIANRASAWLDNVAFVNEQGNAEVSKQLIVSLTEAVGQSVGRQLLPFVIGYLIVGALGL